MKIITNVTLILFLGFSIIINAQSTNREFWVNGACGMCKERIETTAIKSGAQKADWNQDSKILHLQWNPQTTDLENILKEISVIGHDNQFFKTSNSVYHNLPACCHYNREEQIPDLQNHTVRSKNQYFVKGNCGSCKERIENAAKKAGATNAIWNSGTQLLTLEFDEKKNNVIKILKHIAEVGHDNEFFDTIDKTYNNLPACCLYPRNLPFGVPNPKAHGSEEEQDVNQSHDEHATKIDEVNLVHSQAATSINKNSAPLTFEISRKELLKAACCNLSESFETNATVDVSFNNAVLGTKQLKMLGLDQKYTALTKELLPEIRGLASAFGLQFIPGRWIGGIQLTKGGGTVVNGYESITGQINTELLKFNKKPESEINFFADFQGRTEMNVTSVSSLKDKWNQSILLHANATLGEMDQNNDGFMDRPKGNQINMLYLLNYNDLEQSGWGSSTGLNILKDERKAGQLNFDWQRSKENQEYYGVGINTSRLQIWNKTGHIFKGKPYQSVGFTNQLTYHQQDSFFGRNTYVGKQKTWHSNLIFENIFGDTRHKYKTGLSFLYDDFDENYTVEPYKRTEKVPGLFFEYTLTGEKYTVVAGIRSDFHNLAGTQVTPRINVKYDLSPKTIVRLSAGRGFRTANIFAENQQYFISNRLVDIVKNNTGDLYGLQPEIAWNYGASLQQDIPLFGKKASVLIDFFRTDFINQVLVDLENPQRIRWYNLTGTSFANSLQTQFDFSPVKNLEVRLSYKYYDVKADYLSGRLAAPFMPNHRGFMNIAYSTKKINKNSFWNFDTTVQYVGKQRIPNTKSNPLAFQQPDFAPQYFLLNGQVSRNFSEQVRIYLGAENLLSYTQEQPIIDAQNPFGNYFDASLIYAPIMPANLYIGIDFKF